MHYENVDCTYEKRRDRKYTTSYAANFAGLTQLVQRNTCFLRVGLKCRTIFDVIGRRWDGRLGTAPSNIAHRGDHGSRTCIDVDVWGWRRGCKADHGEDECEWVGKLTHFMAFCVVKLSLGRWRWGKVAKTFYTPRFFFLIAIKGSS